MNSPGEQSRATTGATISTHVLDVTAGRPAVGVVVRLQHRLGGGWAEVGAGTTDADGRVAHLEPRGGAEAGLYRLVFAVGGYFTASGFTPFFPEVTVDFAVGDAAEHYHVPLLAGPYSYSTYRGS
jgi:5-hydroxyisourate hydrolase